MVRLAQTRALWWVLGVTALNANRAVLGQKDDEGEVDAERGERGPGFGSRQIPLDAMKKRLDAGINDGHGRWINLVHTSGTAH